MDWYLKVLKNYVGFQGRARRKEYWMFVLVNVLIFIGIAIIEGILGLMPENGSGPLSSIYNLAVFLPSLSVAVRRMHDTGRSGWWNLLPIVNIIFLAQEGHAGRNKFGDDPKFDPEDAVISDEEIVQ